LPAVLHGLLPSVLLLASLRRLPGRLVLPFGRRKSPPCLQSQHRSLQLVLIMRDSRIGTYGSVALILTIIAKFSAISLLDPGSAAGTIIGAHMLGRWTSVPLIKYNEYVREQGTGKPFASMVTTSNVIWSSAAALLLSILCFASMTVVVIPIVLTALWLAQWYVRRKLGGITGDVLGAVNSLTELLVYLIMSSGFILAMTS